MATLSSLLGTAYSTQGLQGRQGLQGLLGSGTQGSQGIQGQQGIQGSQGLQGLQGSGSQGSQGIQGSQSVQGLQGTAAAGSVFWTTINKVNDTTRTANTTLTADPDLQFSLAANTKYVIRIEVWFDTTAAGDFKYGFNGPAIGAGIIRMHRRAVLPNATAFTIATTTTAYDTTGVSLTSTGTNGGYIALAGIIQNGATAGTFDFRWAQNTSDAGNTIVRAGSYLEYGVVV